MKITRLIEIFEQLLPIYEKGYKENYSRYEMYINNISLGLCWAANKNNITINHYELYDLFDLGYYEKITGYNGYIFPKPETWQDLKPRIEFMKSEIKDLKKLLKTRIYPCLNSIFVL